MENLKLDTKIINKSTNVKDLLNKSSEVFKAILEYVESDTAKNFAERGLIFSTTSITQALSGKSSQNPADILVGQFIENKKEFVSKQLINFVQAVEKNKDNSEGQEIYALIKKDTLSFAKEFYQFLQETIIEPNIVNIIRRENLAEAINKLNPTIDNLALKQFAEVMVSNELDIPVMSKLGIDISKNGVTALFNDKQYFDYKDIFGHKTVDISAFKEFNSKENKNSAEPVLASFASALSQMDSGVLIGHS